MIVERSTIVGTPTLVESRTVLSSLIRTFADTFLDGLIARDSVRPVAFTLKTYRLASNSVLRSGKGRGHPAGLNFGDCLSYPVAKANGVPLLFKDRDFVHTDPVPAYSPAP